MARAPARSPSPLRGAGEGLRAGHTPVGATTVLPNSVPASSALAHSRPRSGMDVQACGVRPAPARWAPGVCPSALRGSELGPESLLTGSWGGRPMPPGGAPLCEPQGLPTLGETWPPTTSDLPALPPVAGKRRSGGSGPSTSRSCSWPRCPAPSCRWASTCCGPPPTRTCGWSSCCWRTAPGTR